CMHPITPAAQSRRLVVWCCALTDSTPNIVASDALIGWIHCNYEFSVDGNGCIACVGYNRSDESVQFIAIFAVGFAVVKECVARRICGGSVLKLLFVRKPAILHFN